jgi:hypothetical protein
VLYDKKLEQWAGHPVKNHVRVLLCTLPDVLWPENPWKRVGMQDLMEVDSVKSSYKKYIVSLHPDRVVSSGDNNKIYLANRIFSIMTDAFNVFKKENGLK